ncbi:pre-miRNA 5'-monophosphate methyltransferase [Ixodes scapularis]
MYFSPLFFSCPHACPSAMCSLGNNAGAAKFGNFRNYYQFNKPEARLERLPDDLSSFCMLNEQRQIVALDIGCNSGALTTQLYRMLTASGSGYVKVLAIDIDESLIQCAEKSNPFPDSIEYMCLDIMADTSGQAIADYLARYGHKTFDITFCFSVTMWIHLNHGDEGLKSFLVSVCANTRKINLRPQHRGGHLITDEVVKQVPEISQFAVGLFHIQIMHTSASLALNENWDPDVRDDVENFMNKLVPENLPYQHSCEGPDDMPAHIKAILFGSSLSIPITDGKLNLGTWQGIWLCEHRNRAGSRKVVVTINGSLKD